MIYKAKHSRFNSSSLLLAILAIFFVFGLVPLRAQEDETSAHLQKSIEQTRKQLEAERHRISQEQRSQEKYLEEAENHQKQLVDEIVELKFAIASKEAKLAENRSEHKKLEQQHDLSGHQWTEIRIVAADACRKISDTLDLMPPSESYSKQKQLLSEIQATLDEKDKTYIDIEPSLGLLESFLLESRTSAVFDHTIRDGQGYEQQVKLFRLGQILYAFKSSSGQIAAASTSGDEKGFRWNENIPRWAKENISSVIDNKTSTEGEYSLPIDVTQQIAIEQDYTKNGLSDKITAGGPVMIPLAIIAVLALVLIIIKSIFFARQGRNTAAIAEDILAACHAGDFQKAEQIALDSPNVISRTMLSCLSMRRESAADMEDAIAESILHELPVLERFLSSIGIFAGVAPLLGLLGTVTGMISTFDTITVFGSGEPKLMAGGISEALITTATGLVIAIPILLVHSFLSSRSDNLIADIERYSATLLNLLKAQNENSATSGDKGDV
jgi:biopolymer transport protein ExbB